MLVPKDASIGVRMAGEIKAAAAKAAAEDRRSISSLVEKLLVEYLTSEGYLRPENNKPNMAEPEREKVRS